ncbi:MAG: ROK family transcriptional regulator [Planctomycetota bacterium]
MKNQPLRGREIRQANEKMILKIMHRTNPISQSEVARRTGLQASTVFRIFRSLEQQNLIREVDIHKNGRERKGRKPSYYSVNEQVAYATGIDISSYGATLLLFDFAGTTVGEETVYFTKNVNTEEMSGTIIELINTALRNAGIGVEALLGIGLGAPGIIDIEKGEVVRYARFPGMEGYPLKRKIEEQFAVPVYVHNNTSVIALAEYRYGRAQGKNSLIAFLIRAGVGGAYIDRGRIFESQGRTAFEAGHMAVDLSTVSASDNDMLTVEDYIAEDAILKTVQNEVGKIKNWEDLLFHLEKRDKEVLNAMNRLVSILFGAVRNIVLLLNPEVILIISRFRALSQFIAEAVDTYITSSFDPKCIDTHKVIPLQYDPVIACRGAADFVFDGFFETDQRQQNQAAALGT